MSLINVTLMNPAGNTTLIVEGDVPAQKRAEIGALLMNLPELHAEQAGFIVPPQKGGAGRLEMSGGEFCGNASRAFAAYLAQKQGMLSGSMPIEISGAEGLIVTEFDLEQQSSYADMPLPRSICRIEFPKPLGLCPVITFEGITHVIAEGIEPDEKLFYLVKERIFQDRNPDALGMMFLSADLNRLTPLVYVTEQQSLCWEGSCGSGSAAVAAWLSEERGIEEIQLKQPAGEISVRVSVDMAGKICNIKMGGSIETVKTLCLETKSLTK